MYRPYYDDYECETCTRTFASNRSASQHMNALNHWAPRFDCESCDRDFSSQNAANRHMNAAGHWKPRFPEHYCHDCEREFDSANNLKMHLNSRVHRGTNIVCPFCKAAFTTASGVSHHLESSTCPRARNLNREAIYQTIKGRDPHGLITQKLLTYTDDSTQTIATTAAWNGSGYECYICHRSFSSLRGLNQHVGSPVHKQKIYHCPGRQCGRPLVSLAALFSHLESETCGFIRFEKVQQSVGDFLTGGQRLISFS
ncbi:hypothetical protein K432DRAFT_348567 [Lepidopterella palustris CBS 459.81]|uniref:C2H2-type domain-containing protein n=1 Tax=Lepidopterella palustris CBS 459.81 TaxID=1314670 RepID=A0A8E2JHG1_9PEZI|nr:hypothetical protein K432DRAFT_348567 [Lepidopterella palustris CBS 459.81]